jgi:uncharacterized RDD family membrane protein YckC
VQYPSILRRYMATFIDACFIMTVFFVTSYILDQQSEIADYIRVAVICFMFFAYEPICTSRFCTIGPKIAGIRVRKSPNLEKISIPAAYLRIVVKIALGFISLLAIVFTKDRRAIHDFAAGSIVICSE